MSCCGLMGLGAAPSDQAPVRLGALAAKDPILSTASVMASEIMLKMAAVPASGRLDEMVRILNRGQPGLGDAARVNFLQRAARAAPDQKDQAMFDAIRGVLADMLVSKTLAMARPVSGLGTTMAEYQGRTSQGVNDANALFCTFGAGTGAMVGGVFDQFGLGQGGSGQGARPGGAAGSLTTASVTAANIGGCNTGTLLAQGDISIRNAQLAQSTTLQTLALQQAQDARMVRYAMIGGGGLVALIIAASILKKKTP